jgi:hypothetical protein
VMAGEPGCLQSLVVIFCSVLLSFFVVIVALLLSW